MRSTYPRATFEILYREIAKKLLQNNPPIRILNAQGKQDTNQLGIKWEGPEDTFQHNASAVIHRRLVELGLFGPTENFNFGKVLYTKQNQLEKESKLQEITIQGREYNHGLFKFLGFESRDAFEKEHLPHATAAETIPQPGTLATLANDIPFTYYIGVYYSFRSYRVNKFVLAMRFPEEPQHPIQIWQWGFHTREKMVTLDKLPKKVNSIRFDGEGRIHGRHLYMNLASPPSEDVSAMQMHLIGLCDEVGGASLAQQSIIPCTLQTVSFDQYTIDAEAFLLKCTREEAETMYDPAQFFSHEILAEALNSYDRHNQPDASRTRARLHTLQLYLMLQRRNFRIKSGSGAFDLSQLEYRGNTVSKYTQRLTGEYRIWNFGLRRGIIIQSKLTIGHGTPYQAYFYPYLGAEIVMNNPGLEEQPATLVISNEIRHDQLCFSTFVKTRMTLVNQGIFDIRDLRDDNWAEGMFITTGYDNKGIIGGYAVMCKVKPGENCDPCCMTREEAEDYASELKLTGMYNGLRSLWKRKLWKQKSNTEFGCFAVIVHPEKGFLMVRKKSGPYEDLYDLPGGKLQNGESPEEGICRMVLEDSGLEVEQCKLWVNESHNRHWQRADGIDEKLHHIGALYRVELKQTRNYQLPKEAAWLVPDMYQRADFTPFALKAWELWNS